MFTVGSPVKFRRLNHRKWERGVVTRLFDNGGIEVAYELCVVVGNRTKKYHKRYLLPLDRVKEV